MGLGARLGWADVGAENMGVCDSAILSKLPDRLPFANTPPCSVWLFGVSGPVTSGSAFIGTIPARLSISGSPEPPAMRAMSTAAAIVSGTNPGGGDKNEAVFEENRAPGDVEVASRFPAFGRVCGVGCWGDVSMRVIAKPVGTFGIPALDFLFFAECPLSPSGDAGLGGALVAAVGGGAPAVAPELFAFSGSCGAENVTEFRFSAERSEVDWTPPIDLGFPTLEIGFVAEVRVLLEDGFDESWASPVEASPSAMEGAAEALPAEGAVGVL